MNEVIAIDTETYWSRKTRYTVGTMLPETYAAHHLFDCYMVSVSDGAQSWAGHPRDLNWSALEGKTLISHNKRFDWAVVIEMQRRQQIPSFSYVAWYDTSALTAYLCNRRALDNAVEFLLGIKMDKSARANSEGKHWPADFTPEQQKTMLEYARKDAHYTWLLWDKFSDRWPEAERELSNLTIQRGVEGIQIDVKLLDEYIINTHAVRQNIEKTIPWIADSDDESWEDFNARPTSTKCSAEMCRRNGIPCPPLKSEDLEAYEAWEETYASSNPWILSLSEWRSTNRLYKIFLIMKERLSSTGAMPYSLKFFAAHTGRWGGDAKINLQNMPRVAYEHSGHSIDMRKLFIPRPGKRMIVADFAQIEPRVLAWLTGNAELLDLVRSGFGIYEAFARTAMGWKGGSLKKEDPAQYSMAKAMVLGLGYGCGPDKFIKVARAMASVDVTVNDPEFIIERDPATGQEVKLPGRGLTSRKIVAEFRERNPKIKALWAQLDDAFKRSIGEDFVMTLPSGRQMRYGKVRAETRIEPDPKTKQPKRKSVFTADIGGTRYKAYGGLLCENLVQATARDIFATGVLALEKAGIPVLFTCHDEVVIETDSVTVEDVKHIMEQTPDYMPGLPVEVEAKEVERYCK